MTPLIIGIDHGYASIKTANFVFPSGVVAFDAPPPVQQGLLEFEGRFFVCGSGRQPLTKDKTANESYFLLTLAALAKEIRLRTGENKAEVVIAAGLPLTGFGNLLAEGVRESVDEKGLLGIFMGGLTASSAGITAAMVFGVVCAAIFRPKQK